MWDYFKAWLAGIAIALGSLEYGLFAQFGPGYKIAGAFLFAFGLCAICEEKLNLVTGKFGMLYKGEWTFRQILLIFVANLIGVFTIYLIRAFDAQPELVSEAMAPIIAARDNKLWYQHILGGILCGICIQIAVNNYRGNKSYWGIILPVMTFILVSGEHCIADTFYYMWSPISLRHIVQILLVFIGNGIGAFIVLFANEGTHPHLLL